MKKRYVSKKQIQRGLHGAKHGLNEFLAGLKSNRIVKATRKKRIEDRQKRHNFIKRLLNKDN